MNRMRLVADGHEQWAMTSKDSEPSDVNLGPKPGIG